MGRARNSGPSRRGVDLTGIITFAEKEDLIILVSRITEKMIRQISDVFDAPPPMPSDSGSSNTSTTWVTISVPIENLNLGDKSENPHEDDETTESAAAGVDVHDIDPALSPTLDMPSTTSDAPTPQLGELKKELFVIFKKWQSIVLQRVRDIRVAAEALPQDCHDSQSFFVGRGRGYPRGRGAVRGNRGRGGMVLRSTGKQAVSSVLQWPLRISWGTNTASLQAPFDRSRSTRQTRS